MILDDARENKKLCNIIVTQPRRIAARSIAERVAAERGWELGGIVGYQVSCVYGKKIKVMHEIVLFLLLRIIWKNSKEIFPKLSFCFESRFHTVHAVQHIVQIQYTAYRYKPLQNGVRLTSMRFQYQSFAVLSVDICVLLQSRDKKSNDIMDFLFFRINTIK